MNPFALDPDDPRVSAFYAPAAYEGRRCAGWRAVPALRRWVLGRLDEFRPDVVHAHLYHASVLVASLRRPHQARLVLSHQHGDHFHAIGSSREVLDRLAGRRFDLVVGCSQYVERWLIDNYRYSPDRVSYVRNGWSGQPLPRTGRASEPRIICVARFRSQKNHRMLLEAVARVREKVSDVRLQLVGDGPERPALESHVRGLGLDDAVQFVGSVADLWPLLAEARVFALASSYEPLGIAALEAMAAGLPILATDVGGLPEIVEPGVNGYLVSPNELGEMVAKLELLMRDDDLVRRMGSESRRLADQHRAEQMVEGYARLYAEMLSQ